jgi:2-oxoglutarate/2-oxoacid ferredoxin oxidoreductase subunit alpha
MPINDMTFRIGGEAGQGVESGGAGFAKALARSGLHLCGVPDYYSRIRGGHNSFTIRVGEEPVLATTDHVEVLIALTGETVERHADSLTPGGAIIIDEGQSYAEELLEDRDVHVMQLPLLQIAKDEGSEVMVNTAALAAAAALTELPLEAVVEVVEENFATKGSDIVDANRRVAEAAFARAREASPGSFLWKLEPIESPTRVVLSGNQAFAMGSLVAGCKFVAGYPMTPATSVLEYMALHADDWGLVVKHTESEIAAINMCIGAANAGVRAMAPTSGGGFDLMSEGLSLAGMTESPLVILLGGRPGPATGLATRTAQADLFLAMHAGHGEFPRVVLAPHTPQAFFEAAIRAFNIAERYQLQVIVLSDQYAASSIWTVDAGSFDVQNVPIDRGKWLTADDLEKVESYERYALTEDGISPRAVAGISPKAVYLTTGNEHRADGHITEDPGITAAMAAKRLRKLDQALAEMQPPLRHGPEDAQITFVSWGSTYGAVHEAVDALNRGGDSANMVHFTDLVPLPVKATRDALATARRIIAVEGNAQGQLERHLWSEVGIRANASIRKYDGRGFTADYILESIGG